MKFNIWNFPKKPLPDVLSFVVDNRGKTVPTAKSGHILIATNCVRNENLYPSYEKVRYLSEDTYQNWFRAHPVPGDILFVCKGTPGRTCMVPDPIDFCIAQDMVALRANPQIIYNKYLLTVLRSKRIQKQIEQTSVGDVIPHFKKSFFDQILIPVPPMHIQQIIGDFYFAFSNKVELNKRINNNLEQQAMALYENTFCIHSNIATKRISLSDLMDYAGGSQPPASEFVFREMDGYIRFVQIRDYDTDSHITYIPISTKNKLCEEHDIMIARYGASLGRICFGINGAYNVALAKVFPKQPFFREFLRCYLSSRTFYEGINNKGGRSAQAGFNQSDINSFELDFPVDEIIVRNFEDTVAPMFEQRLQLKKENQRLSILRDTLLPKLMSGELDVSDINI